MRFPVAELLQLPHARTANLSRIIRKSITGVSTDSRQVGKGHAFIALRGEHHDGHNFIAGAIKDGALLAVADTRWTGPDDLPILIVEDTTAWLGALAHAYRRKFPLPVIAVAGSNGKTTTKEMIAAVLRKKFSVLSTKGNLNNHIGVPQTLFRLEKRHDIAVVEIGTNHPGEIEYLCSILEPTHGIISNIGREHLEFFHDIDGVAAEEGRLFAALRREGMVFVNADDARIGKLARGMKKTITYGFAKKGAVDMRGIVDGVNEKGCGEFTVHCDGKRGYRIRLGVPGIHALSNALAAAAVGAAFKVPQKSMTKALEGFRAVSKRMEVMTVAGVTILNDTYNANPDSMLSALETLRAIQKTGKKIVVLADMRELGERSEEEHRGIGAAVARMKFEYLLTYGEAARWIHDEAAGVRYRVHYDDQQKLGADLAAIAASGDAVLIKGSRGLKMENVTEMLAQHVRRAQHVVPPPDAAIAKVS